MASGTRSQEPSRVKRKLEFGAWKLEFYKTLILKHYTYTEHLHTRNRLAGIAAGKNAAC